MDMVKCKVTRTTTGDIKIVEVDIHDIEFLCRCAGVTVEIIE